jgi:hypothetical protein
MRRASLDHAREFAVREELNTVRHYIEEARAYLAQIRVLHQEALDEFSSATVPTSLPGRDVARCDKSRDPPYQLGFSQQRRVTLIRHDGDVEFAAPRQHGIKRGRSQHI